MEFLERVLYQGGGSSERTFSQRWAIPLPIPGRLAGRSPVQAEANLLVKICANLSFLINFQKSELIPTQVFAFVEIHFSLGLG